VDFINSCLRPEAKDTKNKRKVVQPLPGSLCEILKPLAGGLNEPLLTLPKNYNRGWRADLEVAGIPYETPAGLAVVHSLRKSFTTLVQELAGASLSEAQKLARHSTPAMTSAVYTKTSHTRLSALVDDLGERLLA
jgi:integrase